MTKFKEWFFLIVCCFALLLWTTIVTAKEVTLSWNPSEGATGNKVYYGTASRDYLTPIDVEENLTHTLELSADLWYFAVTAYNECGESDYSVELPGCVLPISPAGLELTKY